MRSLPRLTVLALACLLALNARAAEPGFSFNDKAGEYLDVLLDGKVVGRYMYAHDVSTKERQTETYKPFLHVFDAEGKEPITQGAGGKQFPHHRGIYAGWMKIGVGGKSYDRWHMKGGDQVHQKFTEQKADANSATITSLVAWEGEKSDKPIVEEERTMTFHRGQAPVRVVIDFTTKLKAVAGDTTFDGDPEHSGVQYRPHGDVSAKDTSYLYPVEKADAHKDLDYPWVGEQYTLRGNTYGVVEINHPGNPTGTHWSAYRDYGRFGAFAKFAVKAGEAQTLKYRFVIADGQLPTLDAIQKSADEFTGATTPTQMPKTMTKPAEGAGKTPGKKEPAK